LLIFLNQLVPHLTEQRRCLIYGGAMMFSLHQPWEWDNCCGISANAFKGLKILDTSLRVEAIIGSGKEEITSCQASTVHNGQRGNN